MSINIAIDGPAGAGKSTMAKAVAKELGYIYVDTGALYRAVGLSALRAGIDPSDSDAVTAALGLMRVELKFKDGEQRVFLNREDVSESIRTPEASMAASAVSAIPSVRKFLFQLQKDIAAAHDCVMDGRDIGTVVLPGAQVKIFLTASPEERARRRFNELKAKGIAADYESVLAEMKQRDYNDANRDIAPLKPAEDAVFIDSTGLNIEQSVEKIISVVKEKLL
ncbi:MAG TPA: (d)CMP kinase [Clostridiales bacterium]|nr:MAG: Cytidylate kinase [Firmicutes bacterium ADurb.Bin262]HOU10789.1 (d)CMP kinase [Clostridiales bacterium]HQH64168.1 (d)CMP kinase [Clostridiales bacterium]HQK73992.1 (d)CMP kinase [Clostridiales bacterium]